MHNRCRAAQAVRCLHFVVQACLCRDVPPRMGRCCGPCCLCEASPLCAGGMRSLCLGAGRAGPAGVRLDLVRSGCGFVPLSHVIPLGPPNFSSRPSCSRGRWETMGCTAEVGSWEIMGSLRWLRVPPRITSAQFHGAKGCFASPCSGRCRKGWGCTVNIGVPRESLETFSGKLWVILGRCCGHYM